MSDDDWEWDARFTQPWCCSTHFEGDPVFTRMIVCLCCGNKRCPKATDHRLNCTRSNDPDQPGSSYRLTPTPTSPKEAG